MDQSATAAIRRSHHGYLSASVGRPIETFTRNAKFCTHRGRPGRRARSNSAAATVGIIRRPIRTAEPRPSTAHYPNVCVKSIIIIIFLYSTTRYTPILLHVDSVPRIIGARRKHNTDGLDPFGGSRIPLCWTQQAHTHTHTCAITLIQTYGFSIVFLRFPSEKKKR